MRAYAEALIGQRMQLPQDLLCHIRLRLNKRLATENLLPRLESRRTARWELSISSSQLYRRPSIISRSNKDSGPPTAAAGTSFHNTRTNVRGLSGADPV